MLYKEIISLNKSFQYSINLQYDIENIDKVKGYIPTKQSVEILKEYLKSIILDSNDKTTVLIGPYGKGKSHLALVLLSIIANGDKSIINSLIKKIKIIDEETAEITKSLIKQKIKFLPLIINSNSHDLQQSLLVALKNAVERYGLEEVNLNTYFDSVIGLIDLWKKEYPETLKVLKEKLNQEYKISLQEFLEQINNYNSDAYKIFTNIYPMISSGVEFNPMITTDIVSILEEFNHKICEEYGYSGMFIIFDEFSKFIEASTDRNTVKDMKILQDIAELCNRSKNNQMHLACITHKSINEYISKLPSNKIDTWRAIEGRFKEIYFTSSFKQNYELIGNTIISDKDKVSKIILEKEGLEDLYLKTHSIFKDLFDYNEYFDNVVVKTFPLNPVASFALPIISEKVAQNERTLFTFLSKKGKNTLASFISKNNVGTLLELDILYNYFEDLFRKELFNERIRDIWIKSDAALKKVSNSEKEKVIKGLAIIKIVDSEENLPSSEMSLKNAFFNINVEDIVDSLISEGILVKRKVNNTLDFMPGLKIDIGQKMNDVIKTKFKNINLSNELNKIDNLGYITAKRYNDEHSMIRFFKHKFLNLNELKTYKDVNDLIKEERSDGLILNLVEKDENNLKEFLEEIGKYKYASNLIFNIPNSAVTFEKDVLELLSVRYLKNDKELLKESEMIGEYLDILEEDLLEIIKLKIEKVYDIERGTGSLYCEGKLLEVNGLSGLNKEMSNICNNLYGRTPKINNELINKRKLTPVILKARSKIVDGIFDGNIEFEGNGPEVTITRATLTNKGLFSDKEVDRDINIVIQAVQRDIVRAENKKKSFKDIYDILEGTSHGFGIRKGVIPIYLAYALVEFKEEIIIYMGERSLKEVPLDSNTLNNINKNPELYSFIIDKGTKEKDDYFNKLQKLFSNKISIKRNKYEKLVEEMQHWVKSLDKFTRVHEYEFNSDKKISKDIINLRRELLKYDINIRNFIFDVIPKVCRLDKYDEVFNRIEDIKKYLDSRNERVKSELIKVTIDKFNLNYKGSLSGAINLWNSNLDQYKKDYLYDRVTNKLMELSGNLETNDESVIIDQLAVILTGLTTCDWNDNTVEIYLETLDKCLDTINNLEEITEGKDSDLITLVSSTNGTRNEKVFKKTEISVIGSTLVNELEEALEEYGASITDDEKRTILIELLEKFM